MKKVLLILLLLLSLVLVSCGAQKIYLCSDGSTAGNQKVESNNIIYVCPDGQQTANYNTCTFEKQYIITQSDAKLKALNFAKGYLSINGWQPTLVNVNIVDGDWLAQIIVSKLDESSFETVIKVDGQTGFASCKINCNYIE